MGLILTFRNNGKFIANEMKFTKSIAVCHIYLELVNARLNQLLKYKEGLRYCKPFLVLVHIHCREFDIFNSHDLLPSDLVAQSVEQR